jgi:hypothetical protein
MKRLMLLFALLGYNFHMFSAEVEIRRQINSPKTIFWGGYCKSALMAAVQFAELKSLRVALGQSYTVQEIQEALRWAKARKKASSGQNKINLVAMVQVLQGFVSE